MPLACGANEIAHGRGRGREGQRTLPVPARSVGEASPQERRWGCLCAHSALWWSSGEGAVCSADPPMGRSRGGNVLSLLPNKRHRDTDTSLTFPATCKLLFHTAIEGHHLFLQPVNCTQMSWNKKSALISIFPCSQEITLNLCTMLLTSLYHHNVSTQSKSKLNS